MSGEYELIGWLFFKLNLPDNSIKNGRFKLKLINPPMLKPPVNMDKIV